MSRKINSEPEARSLQDKAYDLLGEMVIERRTAQYLQALKEDEARGDTADMDAFFARQDQANLKKIQTYVQKQQNRRFLGRTLPRLAQAAAILVAVVALVGGVAMATSETFRVQVMKLMLNVQEEYTELSLTADEAASFDVPAEWKGRCFPAYIPEGMQLVQLVSEPGFTFVTYFHEATGKKGMTFFEGDENTVSNVDTENATVTNVSIRGNLGYLIEKENRVAVCWTDGSCYYDIVLWDVSCDEALRVAESVRSVN